MVVINGGESDPLQRNWDNTNNLGGGGGVTSTLWVFLIPSKIKNSELSSTG